MNILKGVFTFVIFSVATLLFSAPVFAQQPAAPDQPKEEVMKGVVTKVLAEGERDVAGKKQPYQTVKVKITQGAEKDKELTINHGDQVNLQPGQKVQAGEQVVIMKLSSPQMTSYQIVDKYRLDMLLYILLGFFVIVLALNRLKGLGSILGLAISLLVIVQFIVPQILEGHDAFTIIIIGSIFILMTTMYMAHGFTKMTHVALIATVLSLLMVGLLASLFVTLAKLTGLGSEDAYALQFAQIKPINFQGLLLGGIIIGALGVLDDITTGLSAAIVELKKANPNFTFQELLKSGIRIGSEHTSSLVNTLVLAYASVGLPIFLFIVINPTNQPLWVIINSEIVSEEIVRTLAGSIGLVLSVPITTVIAAWAVTTTFSDNQKLPPEKPKVKLFHTKKGKR
jgi:uncharacterized membrane protein